MSWVTVIWSMVASACLTLAAIYGVVWHKNRTAWSQLLFAATAASTAVFTFCELWLMRVETADELLTALKWGHLALLFWLVSIIWFIRLHLGTGRIWLAVTLSVLRMLYLAAIFVFGPSFLYREITSLQRVPFLGEHVTIFTVITSPYMLIGQVLNFLVIFFVADASVSAWRRGARRKALIVGGGVESFLILGLLESALIYWAQVPVPILLSPFYLGVVVVMGYEVSRDVLRASQLVHELQASEAGLRESEARMSLAVDAADLGIWIRYLAQGHVWANDKWRDLFGFTSSEVLDYDDILARVHPDDREVVGQAAATAIAGADGFRYVAEYRVMLADGTIRWLSSQGRVECDKAGVAVLVRGAVRDVTAAKHAEGVVSKLSGRLLSAQEEERRLIARELHDNLSQRLALLSIEIEGLAMGAEDRITVAGAMQQLGARTAEISTEVHNLSHRLHSKKLDALGLQAAVQGHCREVRAQGLQVECVAENVPATLPYDVGLCLFRVVQEGLNNVVKHSGAKEARVTLVGTTVGLQLTIADAGRGFDAAAAIGRDGLGLPSMRERVHLIGGELTVTSDSGDGTTIHVFVPVTEAGATAAPPARSYVSAAALPRPRSVADGDSPNTAL